MEVTSFRKGKGGREVSGSLPDQLGSNQTGAEFGDKEAGESSSTRRRRAFTFF